MFVATLKMGLIVMMMMMMITTTMALVIDVPDFLIRMWYICSRAEGIMEYEYNCRSRLSSLKRDDLSINGASWMGKEKTKTTCTGLFCFFCRFDPMCIHIYI